VKKIDEICQEGKEVDALVWLNYLAFDILSDIAFGEPIGMVANVLNSSITCFSSLTPHLTKGSDAVTVKGPKGETTKQYAISLVDEVSRLSSLISHNR